MDSDAKEFGHARVARSKDHLACQGWNLIIYSGVGNSPRSLNRPQSSTNESVVCVLSKKRQTRVRSRVVGWSGRAPAPSAFPNRRKAMSSFQTDQWTSMESGGGRSLRRTRLQPNFPVKQGISRDFPSFEAPGLRIRTQKACYSNSLWQRSLRDGTGN